VAHGFAPERARFARTHASWVSPADKVWKGKRVKELEQLMVDRLAAEVGLELG